MSKSLRNKKIVFFTNDLVVGGAEKQSLKLARHLRDNHGANVEFWGFLQTNDSLKRILEKENISIVKFKKDPLNAPGIKRYIQLFLLAFTIRLHKPDIILSYVYNAKIIGGLLWRFVGVKLYIWNQRSTVNEFYASNGMGEYYDTRLEKLAVKWTNIFATNSDHNIDRMHNFLLVPKEKITITPNAVELPVISLTKSEAREKFGINQDVFLIGMIANYTRSKDHLMAIKALKRLLKKKALKDKQICMLFVGSAGAFYPGSSGNTYDAVRATLFDLGINKENVLFFDFVENIQDLIHAFDIGLLTSQAEGCPNAILECMANEKPVVGTDIPGIRFAVGEANCQYLASMDDSDKLAEIIEQFVTSSDLCNTVGGKNIERIRSTFELRKMNEFYTEFILNNM